MILLMPIDFALLILLFRTPANGRLPQRLNWRECFLYASVALQTIIIIITEILSQFALINGGAMQLLWLILGILFTIILYGRRQRLCDELNNIRAIAALSIASKFDWAACILVLGISSIALGTLAAGLLHSPHNFDSMTYHLSRAMHWIQSGSLAHYPTHIPRQLYYTPGAEMQILHVLLLSKGDWFVSLVQWFCFLGCAIAASLIAQHYGATLRGQLVAAAFSLTLPMAIIQASSTQNDLVVSFWLICFVYFGLRWILNPTLKYSLLLGSALGLAFLAKGTAYVYSLPFALWFAGLEFRLRRFSSAKMLAPVILIVLAINGGYFYRNLALYGKPLGKDTTHINKIISLPAVLSNCVRNAAFYLASPLDDLNRWEAKGILRLHTFLSGMDPSDPRTTWWGTTFEGYPRKNQYHEDLASNPLHFLLLFCAALFCVRCNKDRQQRSYMITLFVAALLFAIVLKWQPWHTRLHLPLFILGAPFFASVLETGAKKWISYALTFCLVLLAIEPCFHNENRPLFPIKYLNWRTLTSERFYKYAAWPPGLWNAIKQCGCKNVGLVMNENWPEYFLFQSKFASGTGDIRLEHVNVENESAAKYNDERFRTFHPCLLLWLSPAGGANSTIPSKKPLFTYSWRDLGCNINLYSLTEIHGAIYLGNGSDRMIYNLGRFTLESENAKIHQ